MVAHLIDKCGDYFCSECRIRQPEELRPQCVFCGAVFSNYEDVLVYLYNKIEDDKRHSNT